MNEITNSPCDLSVICYFPCKVSKICNFHREDGKILVLLVARKISFVNFIFEYVNQLFLIQGKHLCANKLQCIEREQVCDETIQCFDGSDESSCMLMSAVS